MKTTNLERIFICATTLTLNKVLLFWLIRAETMMVMLVTFSLLVFNFMILAKSVDKLIEVYEKSKKKQTKPHVEV